ncbi:post-GPI attachment to proteins factor 2 [Eurytemora carolleeae]|uniref:post-GPI attachment to proteins factor 2 n=1 Tax=Eurytemora carolleeae TaxID=1294199 RepID=UPI000C75D5E4|nr:post-GPI attachment to proteins factor 2 [Eurytemora carolleeae]|eukprot:XP_023339380.1 post-GPI attachment to proteins factor 2-like [Eurytemora affinis]
MNFNYRHSNPAFFYRQAGDQNAEAWRRSKRHRDDFSGFAGDYAYQEATEGLPELKKGTVQYLGSQDFYPTLFRVKFRQIAVITVSLPFFAFLFCISYSFFNHYDWVTKTHCNVWNIAPSISASIGHFTPQKYVWKLCIALHSAPRLLLCQMYHTYMFKNIIREKTVQQMALLSCTFNVAEVFSLLLLSLVPSIEDFSLHKLSFSSFLFFSVGYISSSYYLLRTCRVTSLNSWERKSMIYKKRILTANFLAIGFAMYFYWRHNTYCEPGIYSVFSLFEYTVVLSNMGYHFTSFWDFYNVYISLGTEFGCNSC